MNIGLLNCFIPVLYKSEACSIEVKDTLMSQVMAQVCIYSGIVAGMGYVFDSLWACKEAPCQVTL